MVSLVGKTQFKALAAVHPCFVLQHCRNFFGGFSGFLRISRDKNGFNLVEKIRIVAHIARITTSKPRGLWIIIIVFSGMMTGLPTIAITEAMEAARPSICTVIAAP